MMIYAYCTTLSKKGKKLKIFLVKIPVRAMATTSFPSIITGIVYKNKTKPKTLHAHFQLVYHIYCL